MEDIANAEVAADLMATLISQRLMQSANGQVPQLRPKNVILKRYGDASYFKLHVCVPYVEGLALEIMCTQTFRLGELTVSNLTIYAELMADGLLNAWAEKDDVLRRIFEVRKVGEAETAELRAAGLNCKLKKVEIQPVYERFLAGTDSEEAIKHLYLHPWIEARDEQGTSTLLPFVVRGGADFIEQIAKWLPEAAQDLTPFRPKRAANRLTH